MLNDLTSLAFSVTFSEWMIAWGAVEVAILGVVFAYL
jgi:hypothetical protein